MAFFLHHRLFLLILVLHLSSSPIKANGQLPSRYRQSQLSMGPLSFSTVVVSAVSPAPATPESRSAGFDFIDDEIKLSEGTKVFLYRDDKHTGNPVMTASLAAGTESFPEGLLQGHFYWKNNRLVKSNLTQVRLRLTQVSVNSSIWGGSLKIERTQEAFFQNVGPLNLSSEGSTGTINLKIPECDIGDAHLNWNGVHIGDDFHTSRLSLDTDVNNGFARVMEGFFNGSLHSTGSSTHALDSFVPDHSLGPAVIRFTKLIATVFDEQIKLTADSASVQLPRLTYKPFPLMKVDAAQSLTLDHMGASACTISNGQPLCEAPVTPGVSVIPDSRVIVRHLNSFGAIEPENYLLPTGMKSILYIELTALYHLLYFDSPPKPRGESRDPLPFHSLAQPAISVGQISAVRVDRGVARTFSDEDRARLYKSALKGLPKDENDPAWQLVTAFCMDGVAAMEAEKLFTSLTQIAFGYGKGFEALKDVTTMLNPVFVPRLIYLRNTIYSGSQTLSGKVGDRGVEVVLKFTADKISNMGSNVSQLFKAYRDSALPATLRYSERTEAYEAWLDEQRTELNGTIKDQQQNNAKAAAANASSNKNTAQTAAAEDAKTKQLQQSPNLVPQIETPVGGQNPDTQTTITIGDQPTPTPAKPASKEVPHP